MKTDRASSTLPQPLHQPGMRKTAGHVSTPRSPAPTHPSVLGSLALAAVSTQNWGSGSRQLGVWSGSLSSLSFI